MNPVRPVAAAALALFLGFAAPQVLEAQPLTPEQRTERCALIRDVAADNGIAAGFLFAGIAQAETNLSHCWSELSWACEGPVSVDCAGPVVAGAGDGPCELMQGGLGMFQFDGGTFDQTIERDGDGVLLLSGNVTRAIDFVVNMVINSQYVDVSTPEEAKAWLNQVTVDGPLWDEWITTVTHYYNGCTPTGCAVFEDRYQHYADNGVDVYFEQGEAFWVVELPPCAPIPAAGRLLEETDTCFTKGGPLPFWRVGIGGESNLHVWTGTTDAAEPFNYAQWDLTFDEPGEYVVEVSVPAGTTTQANYLIDHAGTTDEVLLDQASVDGFVALGSFEFAAGAGQRLFVGDNTGDADLRLSVDALRLTRVEAPGTGGSGGGENASSSGSGGSNAGAAGGVGGEGGMGNSVEADAGCDCAVGGEQKQSSRGLLLGLALLVAWRRRVRTMA